MSLRSIAMGLGKKSKVLNKSQIEMISNYLRSKRNGLRNQTIFLLSVKCFIISCIESSGPSKAAIPAN